ncbi:cysteine-rich venom protein 6-like [Pseudophryne corroboree]|uniref:cysteine-rich venom protein 6-like n=1 Tax=Pseudophryne corroboree TaxID=495146 RepID=UPI00308131E5
MPGSLELQQPPDRHRLFFILQEQIRRHFLLATLFTKKSDEEKMKTLFLLVGIVLCLALVEGNPGPCNGVNENLRPCPSKCPATCENLNKDIKCSLLCRPPGMCQCNDGHVRDSKGVCIPRDDCPKRT